MKVRRKYDSLAGKKIVLLGGSSGLGLATAMMAAGEGAQVVLVSSNAKKIEAALKELPEGSTGYAADLSSEEEVKNIFSKTGKFDHLVFTAGESIRLIKLADIEVAAAKKYFDLRYFGAITAVRYGAPCINPGGSIVLTSGIASPRPGPGWFLGASICAAIEGFTRTISIELSPVRVNAVSPGVVRTNLWSGMSEADREGMYASVGGKLPVQRVGEAEDIAQAYLYCMKQSFMTGQILVTDGGTVLV
jgi:NAD(P)-dependent dehydrogenase (short-subunit alcohol dehydrogenase family)